MGTNPEGSRDLSRDPSPVRPLSPDDVQEIGDVEDDLAEEYEASLEGPESRSEDGSDSDGPVGLQPTSVDGQRPELDDEEETVQVDSSEGKRGPDGKVERVKGERMSGALSRRDALFGQVLADRYRILDLIGKGGMGKVYLAEHVALGKRVAVKVLNPAYTNRPDQVKRFLREAQAASTIGHENVIDITDFGEMPNGQVFFAMEYLQGDDLGKLLKKNGAMPWSRARRVILQICRALQAAHNKGIIHRDMKPENCFLIHRNGIRDFVKVLDFGIAKFLEENRDGGSNPLTQIGALIGTPEYMAPEQIHGEAADLRMDVYAVGCIMYQILTGNLPFTDKTMYGVLSQQVNAKPIPPRQLLPEADIPVEVEAIILRAMEKDKTQRYQSMAELLEAIVAAPRGAGAGERGSTTTNLDAAASAARLAAGLGIAPSGSANPVTPHDGSLAGSPLASGAASASGMTPTAVSSPPWARFIADPKMLTRMVLGLGTAVLLLVVGLVCALNRTDDVERPVDTGAAVDPPQPETKQVEPPVVVPPEPKKPETKVDPVPTKKVEDDPVVIDPDPPEVKDPGVKDPGVKDPKKGTDKIEKKKPDVKKPDPPPKEEIDASWPDLLGPMERRKVLEAYGSEFAACRTISTPKGKTFKVKLKVDGPKGRVLDASAEDGSAEGKCLVRILKSKVRFQPSKKTPQEFPMIIPL